MMTWIPADGMKLEPNAFAAATNVDDCIVVTAGPGAGKTELLAQRADFLLRTNACNYPKRILAISFKVDASSNLKNRVAKRCGNELASRFDSYTFHAFAMKIIERFRRVLTGDDELDYDFSVGDTRIYKKQITFDDMLPLAIKIIENSPVSVNLIRKTYGDVFLDEFQDCTVRQYELVKKIFLLQQTRIIAVGDVKQSIMGWAGALDGIFADFVKDFRAIPLNLYINFRSKPLLLRFQNQIISDLDKDAMLPESETKGCGGCIVVKKFSDERDEAQFIVSEIIKLKNAYGLKYADFTILIRQRAIQFSRAIRNSLGCEEIPYRIDDAITNLESEPVYLFILDFLAVTHGIREPESYIRLMNRLVSYCTNEAEEDREYLHWQTYMSRIKELEVFNKIENTKNETKILIHNFLNEWGDSKLITLASQYRDRVYLNSIVDQTLDLIFVDSETCTSLIDIIQNLRSADVVKIMTIHKSKGLEFNTVFVVGVEREMFNRDNCSEKKKLFFVAISRAKENLYLCNSEIRRSSIVASHCTEDLTLMKYLKDVL